MRKIDQDTFKENKLNFGMLHSKLRNDIFSYRWESFINTFSDFYPEITIKLLNVGNDDYRNIELILYNLKKRLDSPIKYKLYHGLDYKRMEKVTTQEFKQVITKLTNYLHHNRDKRVMLNNLFISR